jgi:hypothetical protein
MYQEPEMEDAVLLDFTLDKFPLLKTAYLLCQQLRLWYQKTGIEKNTGILTAELRRWKEKVKQVSIKEFLQGARMIENHQTEIIRYFENGLTNAKAENLNGKIQRFIANNFGLRNRDFFLYRMMVCFSPAPQKKISPYESNMQDCRTPEGIVMNLRTQTSTIRLGQLWSLMPAWQRKKTSRC